MADPKITLATQLSAPKPTGPSRYSGPSRPKIESEANDFVQYYQKLKASPEVDAVLRDVERILRNSKDVDVDALLDEICEQDQLEVTIRNLETGDERHLTLPSTKEDIIYDSQFQIHARWTKRK